MLSNYFFIFALIYCLVLESCQGNTLVKNAKAIVQEICYDDLGCFNTGEPFSDFGRIALLPDSLEELNTKFYLQTRENTDVSHQLEAGNIDLLRASNYAGRRPTKLIVHGWNDNNGWVYDMAKQFFVYEDCNVIIVKWAVRNMDLYAQASANARVIGAQIAQMVEFLSLQTNQTAAYFHILGHSLGAHIAGYAGERLLGLARITGMDPADPYFQGFDKAVRLDETDADFVDVIHTDAGDIFSLITLDGGMGLWQPSGHIDIYPNGGIDQPGCGEKGLVGSIITEGLVEGVRQFFGCKHARGYYYVIDTIASGCPWRTYRCEGGWAEFLTGRCLRCPEGACNSIVTGAVKPNDGSVNNMLWMATGSKAPFCRYHFHIRLTLANNDKKEQKGNVWVKLTSSNDQTSDYLQLGDDNFYLTPGANYDYLVIAPEKMTSILSVELKWEHDAAFYEMGQWSLRKPNIYPQRISVFSGEFQYEENFCDNSPDALKSKDSRRFNKKC